MLLSRPRSTRRKINEWGQMSARAYGMALVTVAAVLWSTGGIFVRLLSLDVWTMVAWRSLFAAISLLLLVLFQNRRQPRKVIRTVNRPGLVVVPIAAFSMGAYVVAIKLTTVANVMIVFATVPFVASGVAFLWMGEKAKSRVLLASTVALLGIAIMAGSATRSQDFAGNTIAFLMTLAFGVQLVMARRYPSLEMAPVNALGAAVCAVICWPLMAAEIPNVQQLIILALFGITTTALAYLLFLTGGRHIPSGEASLIGLLDVVLAPFWVWLFFDEQPGRAAIIGGSLVFASVLWYLSLGQRREKAVPNSS